MPLVVADLENGNAGCTDPAARTLCKPVAAGTFSGKAVLVDRGCCTFSVKVTNAVDGGASALVVGNNKVGAPTVQMEWGKLETGRYASVAQASTQPVDIPVCMVTKANAAAMRQDATTGTAQVSRLDLSGYQRYVMSEETDPRHTVTYLTVTEPFKIKWAFPLAQASFNPQNYGKIAAPAVWASLRSECLVTTVSPSLAECEPCWALASPFQSPALLAGNIVLFDQPSYCYSYWFNLPAIAQQAGAVAVIQVPTQTAYHAYALPRLLPPRLVPVPMSIPTFTTTYLTGQTWEDVRRDGSTIMMVIPAAEAGSGPNYYPTDDAAGAVADTYVLAEHTHSGVTTPTRFRAGQATFMPQTHAQLKANAAVAAVDPSCALKASTLVDGLVEEQTAGVDCDACHDKYSANALFVNAAALTGKVAVVNASAVYCLSTMTDVALQAQKAGAVGVIVANYDRWTYTISSNSHSQDDVTLPFFNLGLQDGQDLIRSIENRACVDGVCTGAVGITLPPIANGIAPPYVPAATAEESRRTLTQVQLRSLYASESGFYEAAQATFNPPNHPGVTGQRVLEAYLNSRCDSRRSCHLCGMLDSPLSPRSYGGAVALLYMAACECVKPLYHYVRAAAARGASAVIFVEADNTAKTLHTDQPALPLTIPAYIVGKATGDLLARVGKRSNRNAGTLTIPSTDRYGNAPEKLAAGTTTTIIVDENGRGVAGGNAAVGADDRQPGGRSGGPGDPATQAANGGDDHTAVIAVVCALVALTVGVVVGVVIRRRKKRTKLHAYGRMIASSGTQTGGGDEGFDLTPIGPAAGGAGGVQVVGVSMPHPNVRQQQRGDGTVTTYHDGVARDSEI